MINLKLRTWLLKKLNGVPIEKADSAIERIEEARRRVERTLNENSIYTNRTDAMLSTIWGRCKPKKIKYTAHTTRKHPKRNEWLTPKYSRLLQDYLVYDDEDTKQRYFDLAVELMADKDGCFCYETEDDLVSDLYFKILRKLRPEARYLSDKANHGVSEMWESPKWLIENIWDKNRRYDCDSASIFTYLVLKEALWLLYNSSLRLHLEIVRLPNGQKHMLNVWLRDAGERGWAEVPLESTYYTQWSVKDWKAFRTIEGMRYERLQGFDYHGAWEIKDD